MEIKTIIEIAPADLYFFEEMFGASKKDWELASTYDDPIKPHLDSFPNDIASHINDLVQIGIKTLKTTKKSK